MIVIGLTGSVAMGKTAAANMLRDMGLPLHCADDEVHNLLGKDGAAVGVVAHKFPESYDKKNRSIDRKKLGKIIFTNDTKKKELEEMLHPMVRAGQQKFIKNCSKSGNKIAVLDIPLLFETGADKRVDYVICVSAPDFIQKQRAMARSGMTEDKFQKILSAQIPDVEKCARADFVVQTGSGFAYTRQELSKIIRKIKDKRLVK
jgi:dephospho-CoA kinase